MIKLLNLLNEYFDEYEDKFVMDGTWPTIQKMIKRDNPEIRQTMDLSYGPDKTTSKLAYDFGGGEDPMRGKNVTIVDKYSYDIIGDSKFIEADLTKPQKLPPVDLIVCSSFIGNVLDGSNKSIVASNIDNALKSGGYLYIKDFPGVIEEIMEYLPSYKLLKIYWNDSNGGYSNDVAEVLFKK
jgi:hypothetical protein